MWCHIPYRTVSNSAIEGAGQLAREGEIYRTDPGGGTELLEALLNFRIHLGRVCLWRVRGWRRRFVRSNCGRLSGLARAALQNKKSPHAQPPRLRNAGSELPSPPSADPAKIEGGIGKKFRRTGSIRFVSPEWCRIRQRYGRFVLGGGRGQRRRVLVKKSHWATPTAGAFVRAKTLASSNGGPGKTSARW